MKHLLLMSVLFSGISYGQTIPVAVENNLVARDTNTTNSIVKPSDEGTNNPIITGSVKYTVNGINYYIKENENISIIVIEEKK
jgi:hypothetical protein